MRNKGSTRSIGLVGLVTVLVALSAVAACQDGGRQLAVLVHDEPVAIDRGHQYWAGLLTLSKSGECLQLRDINADGQVQTIPSTRGGVFLAVWPRGHRAESNDSGVSIIDYAGRIVANTGDVIRVGGYILTDKPVVSREEIPDDCRLLPKKLVGQDVTVITDGEARTLQLPGSSLYFLRELTRLGTKVFRMVGLEARLELHGDCLRLGGENGPVPIWPAGFTPYMSEGGMVEVRNSAGVTITRIGDWLELMGAEKQVDSGPCSGPHWVDSLITKVTRGGAVVWER